MRFFRMAVAALLAAGLLFVSGCGVPEDVRAAMTDGRVVTDDQGNRVVVPRVPQRIVSLDLASDEIVLDMCRPNASRP